MKFRGSFLFAFLLSLSIFTASIPYFKKKAGSAKGEFAWRAPKAGYGSLHPYTQLHAEPEKTSLVVPVNFREAAISPNPFADKESVAATEADYSIRFDLRRFHPAWLFDRGLLLADDQVSEDDRKRPVFFANGLPPLGWNFEQGWDSEAPSVPGATHGGPGSFTGQGALRAALKPGLDLNDETDPVPVPEPGAFVLVAFAVSILLISKLLRQTCRS